MLDDAELAATIEADEKNPTPRMPKLPTPRVKSTGPVRKVWVKVVSDCRPWAYVHASETKNYPDAPLAPMGKSKRYLIDSDVAEQLEETEHVVILESPK